MTGLARLYFLFLLALTSLFALYTNAQAANPNHPQSSLSRAMSVKIKVSSRHEDGTLVELEFSHNLINHKTYVTVKGGKTVGEIQTYLGRQTFNDFIKDPSGEDSGSFEKFTKNGVDVSDFNATPSGGTVSFGPFSKSVK